MNLFFYGTLCDRELLETVLGCDLGSQTIHAASLDDHAVYWVKNEAYPVIVAEKGGRAQGILLENLTSEQVVRLDFYEGGFGYELRDFQVDTGAGKAACRIYWPDTGVLIPASLWSLDLWQQKYADIVRKAAVEAMSNFGKITAHDLVVRYPMMLRRAASQLRAARQTSPHSVRSDHTGKDVVKELVERSHLGFYALDTMVLRHPKFDGSISEKLRREVFLSADASIVLPYDPKTDQLLLVEQFRMGPTGRGDPRPWCLEPVAGLIDIGEEPEETAHREAFEEAGIRFTALEKVAQGYSSPGASSGYFFLFVGLCDLSNRDVGASGCFDEGEDIRSHILGFDQAIALVDSGEINILPTILCLNWLARHRARLRGAP